MWNLRRDKKAFEVALDMCESVGTKNVFELSDVNLDKSLGFIFAEQTLGSLGVVGDRFYNFLIHKLLRNSLKVDKNSKKIIKWSISCTWTPSLTEVMIRSFKWTPSLAYLMEPRKPRKLRQLRLLINLIRNPRMFHDSHHRASRSYVCLGVPLETLSLSEAPGISQTNLTDVKTHEMIRVMEVVPFHSGTNDVNTFRASCLRRKSCGSFITKW